MLRMCVTLSWHDYANAISVSLSVQRHWDKSKGKFDPVHIPSSVLCEAREYQCYCINPERQRGSAGDKKEEKKQDSVEMEA